MTKHNQPDKHNLLHVLAAAKTAGLKITQSRHDLIELLHAAPNPQTAYELRDTLSRKCHKDIKPTTIYRALDALCEAGVVVKIESENSFTLCNHVGHDHQHAFLVCKKCGTVAEIADHAASEALVKKAQKLDFQVSRQILELHGLCRSCRA